MERYGDILRSYDIKPSYTRLLIYQYLKEHKNHPTADEIYQSIQKNLPTLSKTTVYNTLHLFIKKHLATMIMMDETETRYDLVSKPHAHFKCLSCSKIYDVDVDLTQFSVDSLREYVVNDAQLLYRGICPSCQR